MTTYRISETAPGIFAIATKGGDLIRTTEGSIFTTPDEAFAREALDFLSQPVKGLVKRKGSQRLKSMFGTI